MVDFKHICFILGLIIQSVSLYAQASNYIELPYTSLQSIHLNLDECFSIQINTQKDLEHVIVKSKSEGVYQNQIRIKHESTKNQLQITTVFPPILNSGYDKLSAHKVLVFEVEITLPEKTTLYLKSNVGFVEVVGNYHFFNANLNYGDIDFKAFTGNAKVATYRGHIYMNTQDAHVKAESRNGKVEIENFNYKKHQIELKSVDGDIKLKSF